MPLQQQQEEAKYEAALEQRRHEVEAERLRRDLEQLRLVSALSRMSDPLSDQPPGVIRPRLCLTSNLPKVSGKPA